MMLWNILAASYLVYADIIRHDEYHYFEGIFNVVHKGRMLRVLMSFNNVKLELCAVHCAEHLRCKTFNYHHDKKNCELTDEDFDDMNVDNLTLGWYNYGTPPKVDGGWSKWRNFTECTEKCGVGTLKQWRDCDSPEPQYGGAECTGIRIRTVKCNNQCKVDGGFGEWKDITKCSQTCGDGTLEQRRDCDSPKPEYGGADCAGGKTRTVNCNNRCKVDGGFSEWKDDTECSQKCGDGTLTQRRRCDSPKPEYGGANCSGKRAKKVGCNNQCKVVDVAFEKTARQSSTWGIDYQASNAVDGSTSSYATTDYVGTPWWEVDFGEVREIKEVYLNFYLKNDNYNQGLSVKTQRSANDDWVICKDIGDVKEKEMTFTCEEQLIKAQILRVQASEVCYLDIAEVRVYSYQPN